jgi:hypothetical protein
MLRPNSCAINMVLNVCTHWPSLATINGTFQGAAQTNNAHPSNYEGHDPGIEYLRIMVKGSHPMAIFSQHWNPSDHCRHPSVIETLCATPRQGMCTWSSCELVLLAALALSVDGKMIRWGAEGMEKLIKRLRGLREEPLVISLFCSWGSRLSRVSEATSGYCQQANRF